MQECNRDAFVSLINLAAQGCPSLTTVGDLSGGIPGDYVLAEITRLDGIIHVALTTGPASLYVRAGGAFYT
jgi:hypothetical protein